MSTVAVCLWPVLDRKESGTGQRELKKAEKDDNRNRNDTRRFYAAVNGAQHNTVPAPAMSNDREGNLLTDKTAMAARWKKHITSCSTVNVYRETSGIG